MKHARQMVGLAVALLLWGSVGGAQEAKHESQLRSVHGIVSDKADTPIPGARPQPRLAGFVSRFAQ